MITLQEAIKLVDSELKKQEESIDGIPLQIIQSETIEEDFGWVFFYNSKEYLEKGNLSYALAGNCPLIFDRQTGLIHVTGTSDSVEFYINQYREKRNHEKRQNL
ncbi:MAG: hypothetical protein HYZ44_13620 [Bacteroidetes bacterium]|nr:hypothetical protein [Bacteroidota bacterium]